MIDFSILDILLPYFLYEFYGDIITLAQNYETMIGYLNYLTSRAKNNIVSYGLGDWLGITKKYK
jgi:alpha-L-rhamnosidase